ncbi:LAMI_0H05402g1_1 [Lachancea mirantina]|uniref:Mediator of RNA polymerase II transcription subunit 18 n=1 Tax=Lachancea mirantina TaxID=1230905 RepID=A0A1G4KF90_9SACH|nr:LAMI_0H05402g1_1 [Lachancea mirantina]
MVQQLSLFSVIDDGSYDLCISTLSALSGLPPIIFSNFSMVSMPNQSYDIERVNSKNQLIEQCRIKACCPVPLDRLLANDVPKDYKAMKKLQEDDISGFDMPYFQNLLAKAQDPDAMLTDDSDESQVSWTLSISDIPSAGNNRKVSMQTITESTVASIGGTSTSILSFLTQLGYVQDFQHLTAGVKYNMSHGVVLELSKVWKIHDGKTTQITKGGYLVKAYVNVQKGTDIKRINRGVQSLCALQKELNGYIDLEVPDRKAMDSRIDNLDTL